MSSSSIPSPRDTYFGVDYDNAVQLFKEALDFGLALAYKNLSKKGIVSTR